MYIGCCPLYVSYYLLYVLYVLTWELNRYGRTTTTVRTTTTTTTTTHFKSLLLQDFPWNYEVLKNLV